MDEAQFWQIIDSAWDSSPDLKAHRESALKTLSDPEWKEEHEGFIEDEELLIEAISEALDQLSQDDLLQFDRILEQKLYDIDREEIQEHTDGSDDGFLYCRGYIVAIGKQYYDAINTEPSKATLDRECESIAYISANLYEDKFGELPPSGICRETASNLAGWSDE